jgi:riboflavin synthase
MFTGIIETTGELLALHTENENVYMQVRSVLAPELRIDQSLAHDGICLTVTAIDGDVHTVCAVPETISKTSLKHWQVGKRINLERCMPMNGRLDGHLVQGHVDGTGTCIERFDGGDYWRFVFSFQRAFAHLLIEKGSVCINGTSLTCFHVTETTFEVTIIPYTYHHTNFNQLHVNDTVNLEFDVIGKYLARFRELGQ